MEFQAAAAVVAELPSTPMQEARHAELAAMPTLADITGIEPALEECNIYLCPLRAGAAAGAVINEATKISEIAAKTDALPGNRSSP